MRNVLFRQGCLLGENTSVWCFWSSDDRLFQEAFRSSDLPQIPADHWTRAVYTQTTFTLTKHVSQTNSRPAGSGFFPSCLLSVYTTNLQVLFELCSFLQCSCRSNTQTHAGNTLAVFHAFSSHLRYETHRQHTRLHAYTLCSCRPPVAIRLPMALLGVTSSPRVAWCSQHLPMTPP